MKKDKPVSITVADYIADRLASIDKTQRQIAEECGFESPNIITMFKQGRMKLPLDRIGTLAKALDVDAAYLLRLAMQEYLPNTWAEVEDIFKSTILTENELHLVRNYRELTGNRNARSILIDGNGVIAIVTG
jgi:transcriptional regulator with XRE-family HTH domain